MRTVHESDYPICPIGAPGRDFSHHRRPPPKPVAKPRPTLPSSGSARPQGMVFSIDDLPQDLKNIGGTGLPSVANRLSAPLSPQARASRAKGVIFNVDELPQDLKELAAAHATKAKPT
ncbi:uncharacterized protein PGTG_05147 [Puccinia graminis f. sp. tritici CRL 75-36-700-3]|uniref:Uncharacterized protein n=1 Tax=Puccinia graminis f. sp. tritici (strain CRL 75-36-700-3 / race SCCL) TaxID=418459 RepID=E3K6S2_PUCGT|nr:uncharacterized protein PGTG_05147 [Puccinia graminis f. sp. tritici CRL 75-36-700-3]EFP79922.1 hypothetical protein PGTG_05147 [Puccinia graminis f. sp. tritici CRL 75-36-700-3]